MRRETRRIAAVATGGLALLLVLFGLARIQYVYWVWDRANFVTLFTQRIRSELPPSASVSFVSSGPDQIFVGNIVDNSRFICGTALVRLRPGADVSRHVYGLFVVRRLTGLRFNDGYTPGTSRGEESQSTEFCRQARAMQSQ